MILILQIAAGIVLGFLILQNLPRILHMLRRFARGFALIALTFAVVAALVLLALALKEHSRDVGAIVAVLAMLVLLMVVIQYTARGLGYLYVSQRQRVAVSRRLTNLLRMVVGVHPSWHTASLPNATIATKVGDALFTGLWLFLILYFLATTAVLPLSISIGSGIFSGRSEFLH